METCNHVRDTPLKGFARRLLRLFAIVLLLGGTVGVHATVRQPNGEYQDAMDDLSVKVLGGMIKVTRTWQADDINKGQFRWYFNPAWADLQFTYDSIDGSVKQITRSGSQFTKTGTGVFVFDQLYFIKQTVDTSGTITGWRWYDPQGNYITYAADGKITAYGDRNNVGVSFTRNADGTINQLKDQNGNVALTYQYSGGQVSKISDRGNRSVSYQYSNGLLSQVTDVLGYNWTYSYTGGLLTSKTDPENRITSITYSGNRVVRITDPMTYQTNYIYTYDHFKRVYTTVETSPTNVRTETHYDANGKVIYQQIGTRVVSQLVKDGSNVEYSIDERGLQTKTVYDTRRNPTEITYPDGTKASATYDAIYSNVTSRTDELGVVTSYSYDSKGNLKQVIEAVGYPEQRTTNYTYDNYGQRLTQTIKGMPIPSGVTPGSNDTQYQDATTTWTYDNYGNVATSSDPLQDTTTFTLDVMGHPLTRKDARGYTTTYEYYATGWLKKNTDPLNHSNSYEYDKVGNHTKVIDALNYQTTYAYYPNNWLYTVKDALALQEMREDVITYFYDKRGALTQRTDQSGASTSNAYDNDGRMISTNDSVGNTIGTVYGDAATGLNGQVIATTFPTYAEQYKYDNRGRRTQVIRVLPSVNGQPAQQQTATSGYDAKSNVISTTDSLGRSTQTSWDALGHQVQLTDVLQGTTAYKYSVRGDLLSVIDGKSQMHRSTYDLVGRILAEVQPRGETIQYAYDDVGHLITRTNPKGERRVYSYDEAGRLIHEDQYPKASSLPSQSVTYNYDARNMLSNYTQTGDTQSSATYVYDANGRKASETVTYGSGAASISKTIMYDYYANGLKRHFTYPEGTVVTYGYTANNLLASATTADGNTIQFTGFIWNMPTQMLLPGVVRDITLDPLQRPVEIKVQAISTGSVDAPNGVLVMDYQYTYDIAGNIVKRVTEDGEYDYTYDNLDRLTKVTPPSALQVSILKPNGLPIEQYAYDAASNRVSSTHQSGTMLWVYNENNELLNYMEGSKQISQIFDPNGNMQTQLTGDPVAPSSTRNFSYNPAERLTEVDDNGTAVASYQYDPMGRRIRKQANGKETWFQYADEGLVAEFDSNGFESHIYGWKPSGA